MTPPLAVEQLDGSRIYRNPRTGEEAPSVTSVLAMINKPGLQGWATRKSGEYADRHWEDLAQLPSPERVDAIRLAGEREASAARATGTAVHELIESWMKGIPHENSPEISGHVTQFLNFLIKMKPVFTENETTVWSHRHRYAGTLDAIAIMGADRWMLDIKTGRSIHGENAVQLAALAGADFIIRDDGTEEELPVMNFLGVLHIRPRSWHLYAVNEREENFSAFLAARRLWDWRHDTEPVAFRKVI